MANRPPKGARDFGPAEMQIRDRIFATIRATFRKHGGVEIDTPIFELTSTLLGKYGDEAESKLIYNLADQGGQQLSLRYDLTVPFSRYMAATGYQPIRRYQIGKVYRRDNISIRQGRYREFYQCDFDIAGDLTPMTSDAETLRIVSEILSAIPEVGEYTIHVNHRGLIDGIMEICGVPAAAIRSVCSSVDKLDKKPWEYVRRELIGKDIDESTISDLYGWVVARRGESLRELAADPKIAQNESARLAIRDLELMFTYTDAMGGAFLALDLSLVRGLDYYTGVVFEAKLVGNRGIGSISAGGRYDDLLGASAAKPRTVPAVGCSIGVERIFALIPPTAAVSPAKVFVAAAEPGMELEKIKVARELWAADIPTEFAQQRSNKLRTQLARAAKIGINIVIILSSDTIRVKNTAAETEITCTRNQVVAVCARQLYSPTTTP